MLSPLPTRTVTRSSSPHRARPVTSASNGVYPPECSATRVSPAHSVPWWVAASQRSTIRRPCHVAGTRTSRWYQTSPTCSRSAASVTRSL